MTTWKDREVMKNNIIKLKLKLFDGAAGSAASSGTGEAGTPSTVEASSEPIVGYKNRKQAAAERERKAKEAILGKSQPIIEEAQAVAETATEQSKENSTAENKTAQTVNEEPKKKSGAEQLEELMKDSEFRKAFSDKAQGIIDQRFKEFKSLQTKYEALEPIIEALTEKYGTEKDDIQALTKAFNADVELYEALGEKHGMSGQQYKTMLDTQRTARNEQKLRMEIEARMRTQEAARKIQAEAEEVKKTYADFDLQTTLANPKIREMLKVGVPLKTAYEAANIDKILQQKSEQTEQRVVENIKARSDRPIEGGANAQSGAVSQNLAAKLTKQERERLAQRAIRGEKITLQ